MHMCVLVHMCGCACGGQGLAWNAFLNHFLPYFCRQSLLLNQELTDSAKLAGQQALGSLLPPSP